jgi:cold shock protein
MKNSGVVKFFNNVKGFGFIIDGESQKEVFVHSSGLIDEIRQNDQVSFLIKDGKKGPNAVDVRKV